MNNPSEKALTRGVHHVGLTVENIEQTALFFKRYLGYQAVGSKPEYPALFISDGHTMLTLWQVKTPESHRAFDRHSHIGLHHLALKIKDRGSLEGLYNTLKQDSDIKIEFAPEPVGESNWMHMMCFLPGGPRLELICER